MRNRRGRSQIDPYAAIPTEAGLYKAEIRGEIETSASIQRRSSAFVRFAHYE
jgi:hypothetical protein